MQAIETQYKGYRFRSRVEARWAVLMDALSVSWEYEKEGFNLGAEGLYLPDFWLPTQECWVEIKGQRPTTAEMARATALAEQSRYPVHLFWGKVAPDPFWSVPEWGYEGEWGGITFLPSCNCGKLLAGLHSKWSSWGLCHACGAPHISDTAPHCECRPGWHHCAEDERLSGVYPRCYLDANGRRRRCRHDEVLGRAYAAATSARFEYGESGAPRKRPLLGAAIPWGADDPGLDF